MKNIKRYTLFFFLSILLFSFSCNKKDKEDENGSTFSKTELLTNLGDNIILPGYNNLKLNIEDFESKHNAFLNAKTAISFDSLKNSWKRTYIQWNKVSIFNFGPAVDFGLQAALGTFPTDSSKILSNISSESYNLSSSANIDAIGIPAFDFLLYRYNAFEEYSNNTNYSDYALALITKMKEEVNAVYNLWNTSYLVTFKTSTGTESTSAFSIFINSFVKSYEEAKWTKLGIPLGKQSLGIQQPFYIETRLSKIGFKLFSANIEAWRQAFKGDSEDETSGVGLDDYLIDLERSSLVTTINSTLGDIVADIEAYNSDFENILSSDATSLDALYTKIQNLTVSIKTDMTSVMGVLITYQDNDGD
jgi:uncharacterized protein